MKYVTMMDCIWKISESNFKKLAKELIETDRVEDMDRYGKMIIDRVYTVDEVKFYAENDGG